MSKLRIKFYIYLFLFISLIPCCSSTFSSQLTPTVVNNVEGTLEIRSASYFNFKKHRNEKDVTEYALKADNDVFYSLIFTDHVPGNLKTGQHLKIRNGKLISTLKRTNELAVSAKNTIITGDHTLKEIPSAFGPQKALVILVNFQNQPNNKPWTLDEVKDPVFRIINNQFSELSYKQTTVVGTAVGWYTLPIDNTTTCSTITNSLPTVAKNAASAAGVDISQYNRFIYMFPDVPDCLWSGVATVGGTTTNAWLNGINMYEQTSHLLGHNFGLSHSNSLECETTPIEGNCTRLETGDLADTMGFPHMYPGSHFNAFQKERLGWLNFGTSPSIQTVTTSGIYTIYPYETADRNVKALKVLKRTNTNGTKDYYYLEYRQGLGFDQSLLTCLDCNFTKGILFHQANDGANTSDILDMTPLNGSKNKLIALLPLMQFKDVNAPEGGVTFDTLSADFSGAKVRITFGAPPPPPPPPPPSLCIRNKPTLSMLPDERIVKPGESARYVVTMRNNDNLSCVPTRFSFSVNWIHDKVTANWTPISATVAPGASQAVEVTVATTTTTPTGFFLIRTNASNQLAPGFTEVITGTLGVQK